MERVTIPIGLSLSRNLIPQVINDNNFLNELISFGINYEKEITNSLLLKSSQGEFDWNKIKELMGKRNENPIYISNDNYVIDGHHRWISAFLEKRDINVVRINLPVLEILRIIRNFKNICYKQIDNKNTVLNKC